MAWGAFGRPSMAAGMTSLPTNHMGRALDGSFLRARRVCVQAFGWCSYQKSIGRDSPIHASFLAGGKIRFLLFDTIESTCNQCCGEIFFKKLSEHIILPFVSACPRTWKMFLRSREAIGSKCVRPRGSQMSRDFEISAANGHRDGHFL